MTPNALSRSRAVAGSLSAACAFVLLAPGAVAAQPQEAVSHYRAGYNLLQNKDYRNAAIELEAALLADSTYVDAEYALGMARAHLGEYDKAAAALDGALRHGSDREDLVARLPKLLGDVYYQAAQQSRQQHRFGEAIQRFETSLRHRPGNAQAYYSIGLCYVSLREPGKALPAFRAAIAADPAYGWPYKSLGDLHRQAGQLQDAAAQYERAIALDSTLVQAYGGLARVRIASGDLEGAASTLRQAVAADPKYAEGLVLLGTTLNQLGRHGEAVAPLRSARDLDARDAEAQFRLAEAYLGAGQYRAAVDEATTAVSRKRDFYAAQVVLADAHAQLGQVEEARRWYRSAQADSRFKDYSTHKLEELDKAQAAAQGRR